MDRSIGDLALVDGIRGGDVAAIEEFVRRFTPGILVLLRVHRVPASERPDVCQHALLTAIAHLRAHGFDPRATLGTWLARVVKTKAIDSQRRRRRIGRPGRSAPRVLAAAEPGGQWAAQELNLAVGQFLRGQTPQHRSLFTAVHFRNVPIKSAAVTADLSVPRAYAVLAEMHRALEEVLLHRPTDRPTDRKPVASPLAAPGDRVPPKRPAR